MNTFKRWGCILMILLLLSGCAEKGKQEDFAASDTVVDGFLQEDSASKEDLKEPAKEENKKPQAESDGEEKEEQAPSKDDDPKEEDLREESSQGSEKEEENEPSNQPSLPLEEEEQEKKPSGSKVSMLSLNVRHSEQSEPSTKKQRIKRIGRLLADYKPAVVGMQEIRGWWVNDQEDADPGIPDVMPESYREFHYYRDDRFVQANGYGPSSREGCAILYDTEVVTLLKEGCFWLSDYPDRESKFEEADCARIAVWAKFKVNATEETFYFCTTHLSTDSDKKKLQGVQIAQLEVLQAQLKAIAKKNGEAPLAICGDFNLYPSYESYNAIASKMTDVGALLGDGGTTFPNWGHNKWSDQVRIDYFFINNAWTAIHYEVDQRVFDPATDEAKRLTFDPAKNAYGYYSDHAPVYVEVQFN